MAITGSYVTLTTSDGTAMQAYTAVPDSGKGTFPALMVFQEAFGVNKHIRDIADRFAAQGYVTIAPEFYHRTAAPGFEVPYTDFASVAPHMQAITNLGLEVDVRAAWEWLQKHPQVQHTNIGCIGYCMGGRISFLANTLLPVKAAVSYYGGRIVPDLIKNTSALHAPMLFFWGGQDKHIPQEQIQAIVAELKKENKEFMNVEISYADHGFFCDSRASYNKQAAAEAWPLTLAFLQNRLVV